MDFDDLPLRCRRLGLVAVRVLALCRSLQNVNRLAARPDFVLSGGDAAAAVGLPDNDSARRRCNRYLRRFVAAGWLQIVELGEGVRGGKANVYRCLLWDEQPEKNSDRGNGRCYAKGSSVERF